MRAGCCPDPKPGSDGSRGRHLIRTPADDTHDEDDGAEPHLIRSRHYKNATDDDGYHLSAGVERDVPWVAIAPVVQAIRVLERIVPDGHLLFDLNDHQFQFLFDLNDHQFQSKHRKTGSLKAPAMRIRIEDFVTWVNTEAIAQRPAG